MCAYVICSFRFLFLSLGELPLMVSGHAKHGTLLFKSGGALVLLYVLGLYENQSNILDLRILKLFYTSRNCLVNIVIFEIQ